MSEHAYSPAVARQARRAGVHHHSMAPQGDDMVALLRRLQQSAGNTAVNALVRRYVAERTAPDEGQDRRMPSAPAPSMTPPVTGPAVQAMLLQRYAVPPDLDCGDVVDWLTANSPYSPEWAETRCTYAFHGQLRLTFTNLPDGTVECHVKGHPGLTVTVQCPIDRPTWSPSPRSDRADVVAAWQGMRSSLDAHEQQHRSIGQTWRGTLETRFRAVDFTVTGSDRADARAQAVTQAQSLQQQWQADAQAAQSAIDPFTGAVLSCP